MLRHPKAFTLTELLVVITTIAILAGLVTAAVSNALRKAQQTRIQLEIQQIGATLESFREEYGAYPPNLMTNFFKSAPGEPTLDSQDVQRMFKRMFPRNKEPKSLITGLTAQAGGSANVSVLENGMTAHEALFFWLGGFSEDEKYPVSGPGGPSFTDSDGDNDGLLESSDERLEDRNLLFDFDLSRLGPRTSEGVFDDSWLLAGGGRFIEYDDPRTGVRRRINLWQYYPTGSTKAFVYFDCSRHDPTQYFPEEHAWLSDNVYPLTRLPVGDNPSTAGPADLLFVNKGKFQVLHAGIDDAWGDFDGVQSGALLYPTGPFIGDIADTLSNFATGTLEDAQE